jgi:hypothetical protein
MRAGEKEGHRHTREAQVPRPRAPGFGGWFPRCAGIATSSLRKSAVCWSIQASGPPERRAARQDRLAKIMSISP